MVPVVARRGAFREEQVGRDAREESMAGGTAGRRSERSSSRHVLTGRRQLRAVAPGGSVDTSCAAMLASRGGATFWFELPLAATEIRRSAPRGRDDLDARGRLA